MPLSIPDQTIAASGKVPSISEGMAPIASMLNITANSQQNQLRGIELQKSNQANQERLALQQFTSNPDNFQTNGRIDLDKINAAVPKIAPLTGGDYIAHMTTLGQAQTQAESAKQDFTTTQRNIVGQRYRILAQKGVTNPTEVADSLDELKTEYPNDKGINQYIDAAKVGLQNLQPGPHVAQTLMVSAQSLLSPTEQQAAFTPTAGLVSTGGGLQQTVTAPSVAGNAPSITPVGQAIPFTLSPEQQHVMGTDPTGNPITVDRAPTGVITGVSGAGGRQPVMPPPGESVATLPEVMKIRTDANAAATLAPGMHDNAKNIIQLADEIPKGKWGGFTTELASKIGYTAQDNAATVRQRLGHFMSLQMQQAATAMGANTDAAKATAEAAATGSGDWTPEAIKSTAKKYDAYVSGMEYFNRGMEGYLNGQQNTAGQWGARQFKNAWSANFDPVAMELLNAKKNGDTVEYNSLVKANRGNPHMIQKVKNLSALIKGQIPQ